MTSKLLERLMTHCGNESCKPCDQCVLLMREVFGELDRLTRERDSLANERYICDQLCEKLERERDEAMAIVNRLPKTADGVPIVPNRDKVFAINEQGKIFASVIVWNPVGWIVHGNRYISASQTYFTREAAKKASQT